MMVTILAISFLTAQAAMDRPIAIESTVGTTEAVLKQIGTKAGIPLRVAGSIEREVIGVATPELPLRETLDKIAQVLEATWLPRDGGLTLARTLEQSSAVKRRDREVFRKELAANLDKIKQRVADLKPFDETEAQALARATRENVARRANNPQAWVDYQKLNNRTPGQRLINRFALQLTVDDLEDADAGRLVLSTQPTRMQKRLRANVGPLIKQFLDEQRIYTAARPTDEESEGMVFGPEIDPKRLDQPVRKVLAIVQPSPGSVLSLSFRLVGEDGKYVMSSDLLLGNMLGEGLMEEMQSPPKVDANDPVIELDPPAKAFVQMFRSQMGSMGRSAEPPTDLRQALARPNENDPLAIGMTEVLRHVAKNGQPAVIHCDDLAFAGIIYGGMTGQLTLGRYLRGIKAVGTEQVDDPKWMLYRPKRPIETEQRRLNRKAMARFMAESERDGRATLDSMARLMLELPDQATQTIFPLFLMAMGNEVELMGSIFQNEDMLRLFGTLSRNQRDALRKGEPLGLPQLNPRQVGLVSRMVFNSTRAYMMSEEMEPTAIPDTEAEQSSETEASMGFDWNSVDMEPTERFPAGLPGDLVLSAGVSEGPAFFPAPGADRRSMWMQNMEVDANTLAWHQFQRERSDLFTYATNLPEMKEFVTGRKSVWTLKLDLGMGQPSPKRKKPGRVVLRSELRDDVKGKDRLSYAQLPETLRTEVNKKLKEFREAYKDAKPGEFGGPGRVGPPPPTR